MEVDFEPDKLINVLVVIDYYYAKIPLMLITTKDMYIHTYILVVYFDANYLIKLVVTNLLNMKSSTTYYI